VLRKFGLVIIAAASLALAGLTPTVASARGFGHGGGHFGGGHFGGGHFGGGHFGGYRGGYYRGGRGYYRGYGYGYYGGCWVRTWVPTPWGPRVRLINRCGWY